MSIEDSVRQFPKQFSFKPKVENLAALNSRPKTLIAGMGGSALAAEILKCGRPDLNIATHKSYGLPRSLDKNTQIIASSYSGNTEETLSSFEVARKAKLSLAVITAGGKLLERARKYKIPFVKITETRIQPRVSLGFNLLAIFKLIREEKEIKNVASLQKTLNPAKAEKIGQNLAGKLWNKVPLIYASNNNFALAYNWKIKFNETGKIPAFYNLFPELNHNEMTGFDLIKTTKALSQKFHFIFLEDQSDEKDIQRRMKITKNLYEKNGLVVETVTLSEKNTWLKIFQNLITADWAAINTAKYYGAESTEVPMVEKFKSLIK